MKESNIIICGSEEGYAKALVQAFQRKKAFEANYIILTDKNKLSSYIKEDSALLYIVEEDVYQKIIKPYENEKQEEEALFDRVFVLTDTAKAPYEKVHGIFKYQPVNAIIDPVTAWILENCSEITAGRSNVKVIGVMDYAGGGSPALLGHLIAKLCSEDRQVMLLNMELFPFQFGLQETQYTLSDYIYAACTGSDAIGGIASGMQYVQGNLHFAYPVQCFEDLYELKGGDVSLFLKQLKEQAGCEIIVIVLDFLRSSALEILSGCDHIVCREMDNMMTARKREQLQHMLMLEQKEWLFEKMSYCGIGNDYLLSNVSEDGEVSSEARSMFKEYLETMIMR